MELLYATITEPGEDISGGGKPPPPKDKLRITKFSRPEESPPSGSKGRGVPLGTHFTSHHQSSDCPFVLIHFHNLSGVITALKSPSPTSNAITSISSPPWYRVEVDS